MVCTGDINAPARIHSWGIYPSQHLIYASSLMLSAFSCEVMQKMLQESSLQAASSLPELCLKHKKQRGETAHQVGAGQHLLRGIMQPCARAARLHLRPAFSALSRMEMH